MNSIEQIGIEGIVPVVVIDDASNAVPTARALLAGGVGVMEITLRTAAALDALRAVTAECPRMLAGAGTVLTLRQCREAVEAGATFIVSPGFDDEIVSWCVQNNIAVTPGCVTPTEIMVALKHGVSVIKFFPANIYGGLEAMKALSAPFAGVKFIPTGGVDAKNLKDYIAAPFVHAVGGSWLCSKADISCGKYEKITDWCREAAAIAAGFELGHVGINTKDAETSMTVVRQLSNAFGFEVREGTGSNFAGDGVEVLKSMYLGTCGHIAIRTNSIPRAIRLLERRGFSVDYATAKMKDGVMAAIYLKDEIGGFAIHLSQK
jgi:2-dehydro-3-deoxyphosphogluconate aldolase/(4S)-4-hydroxy-2-oxoglutarate aldolase